MKKTYFLKLALALGLLWFNGFFGKNMWLGGVSLLAYFLVTSIPAGAFLRKYFADKESRTYWLYGFLASLITQSALLGCLVVFKIFSLELGLVTLAVNGIFWAVIGRYYQAAPLASPLEPLETENFYLLPKSLERPAIALFILGLATAVFLLVISRSSGVVTTPWQVIHPSFIYVFAGATVLLGLLLFSRLHTGTLLALIIIHSLVLHSYLPLTHTLLYGADGWRHIATEQRLSAGQGTLLPVLRDAKVVAAPVFDAGTISYSQFWGLFALLGALGSISLLALTAWFVPLLSSICIPLLIYAVGKQVGWGRRALLSSIFLSWIPFALTSTSSFSLPVSLGFCFWLFFVLLLVRRLVASERTQLSVMGISLLVLLAGYALYGVLAALMLISAEVFLQGARKHTPKVRSVIAFVTSTILALVLPLAEFLAGYSRPLAPALWPSAIKQFFGNFTALYLAAGPRPHDIATGNILFNQVPLESFVPNLFTLNRWWLVAFAMLWWAFVVYGLWVLFKKDSPVARWFFSSALGSNGAYFLGRYFFAGDQVLTRRLEPVLALMAVFLVVIAGYEIAKKSVVVRYKKSIAVPLVLVGAFAISASFTLGPDTRTVSLDEYRAMKFVATEEARTPESCVLAGAYPLVALEALSRKAIIGGGFPIARDFSQSEQEKLFAALARNPNDLEAWQQAQQITGAQTCWLVASVTEENQSPYFAAQFGKVGVWRYSR